MEARQAIRKALKDGEKKFGQLLKETSLSRSTLAFHLKDMHKKGVVNRRTDSKDYRVTHYSLTSKGKKELHRQEDIEVLSSGFSLLPTPEAYAALQEAFVKFLEPVMREHALESEDAEKLEECITYSVYFKKPLKDSQKNYITTLLESATTSLLRELVLPRRRVIDQFKKIPKTPNFTLVVRFNGPKIEEVVRKIEIEADEEPLPKLPDKREYLKKRKREDQSRAKKDLSRRNSSDE